MDIGQPEAKRPRTIPPGPPQPQWHQANNASVDHNRHLPPPSSFQPPHQPPPFQRPPDHAAPRRLSGHNEHAYYDPQDPRRPPSRPSHGYQPPQNAPPPQSSPFHGQRDHTQRDYPAPAMIKRDPSEDHGQYGRSPGGPMDHNASHHAYSSQNLDGNRPYHHQPPPQQHGLPQYEQQHQPPPPSRHNSSSYPPPSPVNNMGAPDPYSQYPRSHNVGEPYAALNYPQAGTPRAAEVKRKAQRAAQACDSCRTLKAKCDEGRPTCGTCKEKQVDCNYRDPPPKQPDKSSADLIEAVNRMSGIMEGLRGELSSRISALEGTQVTQGDMLRALLERPAAPNFGIVNGMQLSSQQLPPPPQAQYTRVGMNADGPFVQRDESGYLREQQPQHPMEQIEPLIPDDGSEDDENAEPRKPKDPTIPVDHTTGAARLLNAPGIKEHLTDLIGPGKKVRNDKYPMITEEKRGSLRLYGRGEGTEFTPGYEKDGTSESLSDEGFNDALSDTSSPAPYTNEDFGQIGGLTPPAPVTGPELTRGGIGPDGVPPFEREIVLKLVRSYKDHMNILHPLFPPRQLDAMVEVFLKQIPEAQAKPKGPLFVGGGPKGSESPGNKRKRSPAPNEPPELLHHSSSHWEQRKPGHPPRTITSAIVLLVLALGRICLHEGKIPDVAREIAETVSSPVIRNGIPFSPLQQSPSGLPGPSPTEMPARSRRTSLENIALLNKDRVKPKNIDIIPGLAYFAIATDILGNTLGGNKMQHVHANILAGLYHGQLGRVIESHAYIHQACYNLESVLRRKLSRYKKNDGTKPSLSSKDNQVIFAFWTCLQLESDIIAELTVPPSNILTYEDDMPVPDLGVAAQDGLEPMILQSYSAQLYLRKHLNKIHSSFYKSTAQFSDIDERDKRYTTLDSIQDRVNDNAMHIVAPSMAWNTQTGDQATDILNARLRAKYYGAQVITYRPFILKILEMQRPHMSSTGLNKEWNEDSGAPPINEEATSLEMIDPKIQDCARKGIQALVHSTTAFHKVVDCSKQRLIVTNVWGTAHAQWGNLMTLTACYMDKILQPLVLAIISAEKLTDIIKKTSGFLNFVATRTSALASDNLILRHMAEKAGLLPRNERGSLSGSSGGWKGPESNGGSFTSVNSAQSSGGPEVPMTG